MNVPRLQPRTEAAIYFAVSESLSNAIKYSGARSADVAVSIQDGATPGTNIVVAGVRDFGRGGARVVPGGGLSGIQDPGFHSVVWYRRVVDCARPDDGLVDRWRRKSWASARMHQHTLAPLPSGTYPGVDDAELYAFLERHAPAI